MVLPAEQAAQGDHTGDGDGGQDGRNRDRAGGKQVVRAVYLREHRADHRDRRRGADEHGVAPVSYTHLHMLHAADRGTAVLVGDRMHDAEGARENGIPCIGVTFGFGGAQERCV